MINCCIEVKIAREQNKDEKKEESIPLVQPDEVLSGNDDTGKSFLEARFLALTNLQYDKRLFIELRAQYIKITSSEHVVCTNWLMIRYSKQFM